MPLHSSSIIRDVSHAGGLHQAIQEADPETTLLVLDVDFTLMQPVNPAFQFGSIRRYAEEFAVLRNSLTRDQQDLFATLVVSVEKGSVAAEPQTAALIRSFQKRGGKAVALTAMLTGDLGDQVGNVCRIRCQRLGEQGYSFAGSFPDFPSYVSLDEFPAYRGHHPEYRAGILTSNGEGSRPDKGEVLVAFLDRLGWFPKQVLFVDDKREHLLDMAARLEQLDPSIHMMGIHYKAVRDQAPSEELSKAQVLAEWDRLAEMAVSLSQPV